MELGILDLATFLLFLAVVIAVSLIASRGGKGGEDYFLAGRQLSWWLIGFSLLASNISTEQFIGMSGAGFGAMGMAIASWEWIAAVCLVVVALVLLPVYLRQGVTTMPEFLENTYGKAPRMILAVFVIVLHTAVGLSAILYAGSIAIDTMFGVPVQVGIWSIGMIAAVYTVYGGLKAVVWTDLLQAIALIGGGLVVCWLGLQECGGWEAFREANDDKLHVVLPADHPDIPWTALLFAIFIPNMMYWGTNQPIIQRALGARSLADGQCGIVFAAFLKLLMPFIVILPGIMAFQLYQDQITHADQAYGVLAKNLLPVGLRGLFFAALFGAILSSLDSGLNSISTIFTVDIYKRHLRPDADSQTILKVGRWTTLAVAVVACLIAPLPAKFEGVFKYIQIIAGFTTPGILTVFLVGLISRRTRSWAATTVMLGSIPIYGLLMWLGGLEWTAETLPFLTGWLNQQALAFVVCLGLLIFFTLVWPLEEPRRMPEAKHQLPMRSSRIAKIGGGVVIFLTIVLYVVFR